MATPKQNNVTWSGLKLALALLVAVMIPLLGVAASWGAQNGKIEALAKEHNRLEAYVEKRDETVMKLVIEVAEMRVELAAMKSDITYIRDILEGR